jgi:nicotinamide-nucleotide amidase
MPPSTRSLAVELLGLLRAAGLTAVTAESCTGGLVAAALTAVPGSSESVLGGFVTYSNGMKTTLLGVPQEVLTRVGAVSEDCARAMALGALDASGADLALSLTGIAGPGGGSAEKPVGLVYIGGARRGGDRRAGAAVVQRHVFAGNRDAVRQASVEAALRLGATLSRDGN